MKVDMILLAYITKINEFSKSCLLTYVYRLRELDLCIPPVRSYARISKMMGAIYGNTTSLEALGLIGDNFFFFFFNFLN